MAKQGMESAGNGESLERACVPAPAAVRAALDSILSSPGFKKSERHAGFLRFVCEATLNGEGPRLNESWIAQAVFDRGADYSPGEDSMVRRQAYSVRQKLQEYYANEGKWDEVRIGLPVGRYVPSFTLAVPDLPARPPEAAAAPSDQPVEPRPQPEMRQDSAGGPRRTSRPRLALAGLCVAVAFFALGWSLSRTGSRPGRAAVDPALAELWGSWLTAPHEVVFCFSNPLSAQIFHLPQPLAADVLPHRIDLTDRQAEAVRSQLNLAPGGYMYMFPLLGTNAKMGEAVGAVRMAGFLARAGVSVNATQSRHLSWEDFRRNDLVLLGHNESNRWLDPILSKLPLRLGPWQGNQPTRVINAKPARGEPSEYDADRLTTSTGRAQAYALISMIDGLDGRHRLLLINGLSTEGTEIGLEFLTDAASARQLLAALRAAAPTHSGPWRFQALLRAEVHENVPTRADLVTVHVL